MYPPSKQSSALEDRGSSSLPEPVCFSQTPSSSSPRGAETWKCQMSVVTVSWVKHRWALLGLGWQAESAARVGFHSVLFLSGNFRVALFSSAYYSVCVLGKRLPTHFSCGWTSLSCPFLSHAGVSPRSMPRMETPTLIKSAPSFSGVIETILFPLTTYKDFIGRYSSEVNLD